ncbi:MAG: hypothetical protein AMXMBFR84_25570 [Candidatus Hydrogenedentota bacterium]
MRTSLCLCILLISFLAVAAFAEATLDWSVRVTHHERHNAFTDLVYWKGQYYLGFRHGESHASGDGEIRILRSDDLKAWSPCGRIKTLGDDRDAHFAPTEDTLYLYFGTWDLLHTDGPELVERKSVKSFVTSTTDGEKWSKPVGIYKAGWWVWRVRYHDGKFYGLAYTAVRPKPEVRETLLLVSDNGAAFSLVSSITKDRLPTESDMLFEADGSISVVTRMEDTVNEAFLFRSNPERTSWTGSTLGQVIHSPVVVRWSDRVFVSGRGKSNGGFNTSLWEIKDGKANLLLTLPSGGDTSYPGLIPDPSAEGGSTPRFFVSWYSQHETRSEDRPSESDIYVGQITVK